MLDKSELSFRRESREELLLAVLFAGVVEISPHGAYESDVVQRKRAGGHAFQIMLQGFDCGRPPETDKIELISANAGRSKAGFNRERRESRVMFQAAQAFFGYGEKNVAIAGNAGRGIVHFRIVDTQADQADFLWPVFGSARTSSRRWPWASVECARATSLRSARFGLSGASSSARATAAASSSAVAPT